MIAAFEAQAASPYHFPEATIELAPGEHYAGIVLGKDGKASYHLVLLPHTPDERLTWNAAVEWAKITGGNLPTRREQSLLFANLKEEFEGDWYWSGEQHAATSGSAWSQSFVNGGQDYYYKSYEGRARAVRRLTIE
ncbi:MAG: DUF1566 domain-containing protein [Thiobacillus sp.]|nr:DUF1566 domain-containing protein [Thiobacillus sp.]MBC2740086.1 DUF1566 domain-containing protein [Thiobacillus sp.]MBC2758298.1 DUF1566 domain-containing protein [Thiobacillus sp.]